MHLSRTLAKFSLDGTLFDLNLERKGATIVVVLLMAELVVGTVPEFSVAMMIVKYSGTPSIWSPIGKNIRFQC